MYKQYHTLLSTHNVTSHQNLLLDQPITWFGVEDKILTTPIKWYTLYIECLYFVKIDIYHRKYQFTINVRKSYT